MLVVAKPVSTSTIGFAQECGSYRYSGDNRFSSQDRYLAAGIPKRSRVNMINWTLLPLIHTSRYGKYQNDSTFDPDGSDQKSRKIFLDSSSRYLQHRFYHSHRPILRKCVSLFNSLNPTCNPTACFFCMVFYSGIGIDIAKQLENIRFLSVTLTKTGCGSF